MRTETHFSEDIMQKIASLNRSLPQISQFREHHLNQNLTTSFESEVCQKMVENFRTRNLTLQQDDVPYRVLSHWDSAGLLECERENGSGWRRFNLIERLDYLSLRLEIFVEVRPLFCRGLALISV